MDLFIPISKFWPNRWSVDPFLPFKNLDQIDGPWIPSPPSFKNFDQSGGPWIPSSLQKFGPNRWSVDPFITLLETRTKSTVRGSPPFLFKILTDSAVRGSLHPFFFKFGPIRSSVGPCIPLLEIRTESAVRRSLHSLYKFGQFSGSSILPSSFKNLDLFGRPWIPASPLPVKIRIDLAVHGSLHPRPRNPCYVRGWLIFSHCSRY